MIDPYVGNDTVDGGPGEDTIGEPRADFGTSVGVSFDLLAGTMTRTGTGSNDMNTILTSVEDVVGSPNGDEIRGNLAANKLSGANGNDQLFGNAGPDELHGGAGNDQLSGELGDDRMFGDTEIDILTGGAGRDFFDGGPPGPDPSGNDPDSCGDFDPNTDESAIDCTHG